MKSKKLWSLLGRKYWKKGWVKQGPFSLWFVKWRNLIVSVTADITGERQGPQDGSTMDGGGRRRQKVTPRSMRRRAGALQSRGIYSKFLRPLNDPNVSVVPYLQDVTQSQSVLLLFDGDFGTFYVQEDVPFSPSLKTEGRNKDSVRHKLLRTSQAEPKPSVPTQHPMHPSLAFPNKPRALSCHSGTQS